MSTTNKEIAKNLLGQLPFTAEMYWLLRQRGKPIRSRFSLKQLEAAMPGLVKQALTSRKKAEPGKKIFIFASLHYWIEHAALIGITLAAQGHDVTLGFLPYADWKTSVNAFDLRRQNAYAKKVLNQAESLMKSVSFFKWSAAYKPLPEELQSCVREVTVYDVQYTQRNEEVDSNTDLYQLRSTRNESVARASLAWLEENRPDSVIIPNGTIQEMGVVYRVARSLKIPAVTYEFSDQRQHIWLAQNREVMRQETDDLWEARKDKPLNDKMKRRLKTLFNSRQRGTVVENYSRLWQGKASQGGKRLKKELDLDDRPIVLLATNVLGDSLSMGRQVFSRSMAEWVSRTVQYFAGRTDVQFIIRVHPGEVLTDGLSMAEVVSDVLPKLPDHIRLIQPKDDVNTYDLSELADLGLVYSTTVGLEMAMRGRPVIVVGKTHYRERGFTYDPNSWVTYLKTMGQILEDPEFFRLSPTQVETAWQYAYYFFFEFPRPFPWHLVRAWEDYEEKPLANVLNARGRKKYEDTFRYLTGEPMDWQAIES
jgi:hypothetical protein